MPRLGRARGALGERRKAAGARPVHGRAAQRRLINHSAPPRDRGPRRPPPIPAPLPQKQPLPFTGFKGFCACACVCVSVFLSPPPHPPPSPSPVVVLCACTRKSFFSFPGSAWHRGSDHVKSERGRDRQTEQRRTSTAVVVAWLSGASKRKKRRLGGGGGGGSCGANESKINIYMGRVLKPYFASL